MGRKGKNKRLVYHHACMTNCGQSPPVTSEVADPPPAEAAGRTDAETHALGRDAALRQLLRAVETSRRHSAAAAGAVENLLLPSPYQDVHVADVLLLQAPAQSTAAAATNLQAPVQNLAAAATNLQEPRLCGTTNYCCDQSSAGHYCRVHLCPGLPRKSKMNIAWLWAADDYFTYKIARTQPVDKLPYSYLHYFSIIIPLIYLVFGVC